MKDSFTVQYAIRLWLNFNGVSGPLAGFLTFFLSRALGEMLDYGILKIDLTLDSISQALTESEWREAARKAYDHASKKALSEFEKEKIRKDYLDALDRYVSIPRRRV